MRFLNQDNSRSKLMMNDVNSEPATNEDTTTALPIKSPTIDYAEVRPGRYSAIDILARLFPNQKRNVMELVLQGCNGDALKTIDYFLSLSDNLALNGIKTVNTTSTKSLNKTAINQNSNNNQTNLQQQQQTKVLNKKQLTNQQANNKLSSSDSKRAFVELQQNSSHHNNINNSALITNSIKRSSAIHSAFSPLIKRNLVKDHLNSLSSTNASLNVYNSTAAAINDTALNKTSSLINPFIIDSSSNSILPPMSNYLTNSLTSYPLSANTVDLFNSSTNSSSMNAKASQQPINTNLNQHFLLNNNLTKNDLQTTINPILNTIRVSSNNSSLCSTPSDGQHTNCASCSTTSNHNNNNSTSLLNSNRAAATADALSSVQIYSQTHLNPFSSSLIDFTFNNSSPATIASLLLKNNYNSRFYRNTDFAMDLSNANCDQPIDTSQLQLRFKAIHSSSNK